MLYLFRFFIIVINISSIENHFLCTFAEIRKKNKLIEFTGPSFNIIYWLLNNIYKYIWLMVVCIVNHYAVKYTNFQLTLNEKFENCQQYWIQKRDIQDVFDGYYTWLHDSHRILSSIIRLLRTDSNINWLTIIYSILIE